MITIANKYSNVKVDMKNKQGFINLTSVSEYFKKVKNDYSELKADDENTYKAFNFFVTAYHLKDWLFKGKNNTDRKRINQETIIKICGNIANGIKHFETDNRHQSVSQIKKEGYVEEGYVEEGYVKNPIVITLDGDAKVKYGEKIKIIDLADKIMKFWTAELKKQKY